MELTRTEPTPLQISIHNTRKSVLKTYHQARNVVNDIVNRWIGIEQQVEGTLKEIAPKGEETIIPGAIYTGIAGMGGSILARNRN